MCGKTTDSGSSQTGNEDPRRDVILTFKMPFGCSDPISRGRVRICQNHVFLEDIVYNHEQHDTMDRECTCRGLDKTIANNARNLDGIQ